jgi:hypothetical protein
MIGTDDITLFYIIIASFYYETGHKPIIIIMRAQCGLAG